MWIAFAVNIFIHLENPNIKIINARQKFVVNVYRNENMRYTARPVRHARQPPLWLRAH